VLQTLAILLEDLAGGGTGGFPPLCEGKSASLAEFELPHFMLDLTSMISYPFPLTPSS
jgi:hypothetical protein